MYFLLYLTESSKAMYFCPDLKCTFFVVFECKYFSSCLYFWIVHTCVFWSFFKALIVAHSYLLFPRVIFQRKVFVDWATFGVGSEKRSLESWFFGGRWSLQQQQQEPSNQDSSTKKSDVTSYWGTRSRYTQYTAAAAVCGEEATHEFAVPHNSWWRRSFFLTINRANFLF